MDVRGEGGKNLKQGIISSIPLNRIRLLNFTQFSIVKLHTFTTLFFLKKVKKKCTKVNEIFFFDHKNSKCEGVGKSARAYKRTIYDKRDYTHTGDDLSSNAFIGTLSFLTLPDFLSLTYPPPPSREHFFECVYVAKQFDFYSPSSDDRF